MKRVNRDLRQSGQATQVLPAGGYGTAVRYLTGEERACLLNQTKILLNILRSGDDFTGQRLLLAMANKALVISEPLKDSAPFVAGRHFIAAPVAKFAETIQFYLSHDAERLQIVEAAHRFVTLELPLERMLGQILEQARQVRAAQRIAAGAPYPASSGMVLR